MKLKGIAILFAVALALCSIAYILLQTKRSSFIYSDYGVTLPKEYPIVGMDISHHQGEINFDEVMQMGSAKDSIQFVYIKVTEGTDFKDRKFDENAEGFAAIENEIKDKFVYKILIRSNPKKLKIVVENLKNKKINKKALLIVSKPTLVEITPFGINKGLSIDEISKITNIDTKNMMAFGDAENDIEMIKKVKYGYAMGNSNDELKKIAYKVIQSNNEEGVAKELIKKLNL